MKTPKLIGLVLVGAILFVSLAGCASEPSEPTDKPKESGEVSSGNSSVDSSIEESKYIYYKGVAKEVKAEDVTQIVVKGNGEESQFENITFNISDDY